MSLAAAASLGLGRFAYALLLPHMRSALDWSYAQAGALNTLNAVGYLIGAVLVGPAIARYRPRRLCEAGLAVVSGSLLASAMTDSFLLLLGLRFAAGAAGAFAFVSAAALVSELAATSDSPPTLVIGTFTAGAGFGVVLSGVSIPLALAGAGDQAWRLGWLILAALTVPCSWAALAAARRVPADRRPRARSARWPGARLAPTLVAYGLFGAGYIAYATFVIALLRQRAARPGEIAAFWTLLGFAAIVSTIVWPSVLGRLRAGKRPAVVLVVVLAGTLAVGINDAPALSYCSAVLFGASFLAVITAVTTVAQDVLERRYWAAAISGLTTAFAAGQVLGPVLTGWIADRGGLRAGMLASAVLISSAALIALLQSSAVTFERSESSQRQSPRTVDGQQRLTGSFTTRAFFQRPVRLSARRRTSSGTGADASEHSHPNTREENHMYKTSRAETPFDPTIPERPGWEGMEVHWLADRDHGTTETTVFNVTQFPPKRSHEVHRHPEAEEYFFVLEGSGLHLTDGEPVRLRTGDLVFIPKNEWHGFANDTDAPTLVVTVIGGVAHYSDAGYEVLPGSTAQAIE